MGDHMDQLVYQANGFSIRYFQGYNGNIVMPAPVTCQKDHLIYRIIQGVSVFVDDMHDLFIFQVICQPVSTKQDNIIRLQVDTLVRQGTLIIFPSPQLQSLVCLRYNRGTQVATDHMRIWMTDSLIMRDRPLFESFLDPGMIDGQSV